MKIPRCFRLAIPAFSLTMLLCGGAPAQDNIYEGAPHNYFKAPLDDPATQLLNDLKAKKKVLDRSSDKASIKSMLKLLNVPEASQVLVFSKTSFQRDKISPWNGRGVYFNEDNYVGWVPGGLIELVSMDSKLGPIFYGVDQNWKEDLPIFDRSEDCLSCHGGGMTNNLPGIMVRSVYTDAKGFPLLQAGTTLVDHSTPIKDRWGGWFVTGLHGADRHMGNVLAEEKGGEVALDREKGANLKSIDDLLPQDRYPARGSDIVALMVLEHQIMAHTKLTEASYHVRSAIARMQALQKDFGEPVTDVLSGSALSVAQSHADKVLKCLLFVEEAPLPEGGIEGDAPFQEAFRENRRKTAEGKSLKDFQLLTRIFKYRCSYMIYSRSFDGLPAQLKELVYRRLFDILTGEKPVQGYEHLAASEKRDIFDILRETKPELPDYWRAGVKTAGR
ncbi:MAG: hypothetical protein KA004_00585 [Verrucomicrobiales bacterium]|nr:hypothetical protein [Verrucomicrobiales bacterium]